MSGNNASRFLAVRRVAVRDVVEAACRKLTGLGEG